MQAFNKNFAQNFEFLQENLSRNSEKSYIRPKIEPECITLKKPVTFPMILLMTGLIFLVWHLAMGLVLMVLALGWIFQLSPEYAVVLPSEKGEEVIFKSSDKEAVVVMSQRLRKSLQSKENSPFLKPEQRKPFKK